MKVLTSCGRKRTFAAVAVMATKAFATDRFQEGLQVGRLRIRMRLAF